MEAHLSLKQPTQVKKITTSCEIYSGTHDTRYYIGDPEQAIVEYASLRTDEEGESLELGKHEPVFNQGEVPTKMEDPGLFTLPCILRDSKPFDIMADLGSCVNIIPLYLFQKLNIGLLEESGHIFGLANGTKYHPVGIVKDGLETPLVVGRGFLATANTDIDYKMAKIVVGKGNARSVVGVKGVNLGARTLYYARKDFLDYHLPREWEIARDAELSPFKDPLVFRRKVEFLGAIPINLKSNMWESERLIENPMDWDKPPKNGDGAWHAKIRLIDPDGEEFTKTLQSIPTTNPIFTSLHFVKEITYKNECRKFFIKTKNEFSQTLETASRFTGDTITTTLVTGSGYS
nr:hypothetical protein [Tanacetum cinerariifolium]